jgi:hypothetical protein
MLLAVFGLFTMFEVLGRTEKRFNMERLKKIHSISGWVYLIIFLFVSYHCLSFIISSRVELSSRGTFHSVFALAVLILFALKLLIKRIYTQFYNQVKVLGLLIVIFTFGIVGTSGGYYLLVTSFGTDATFDKIMQYKRKGTSTVMSYEKESAVFKIQTDSESIGRGKILFEEKCSLCHDADSTNTIVGPGLKGVLKNPRLPVSKRPSTPENVMVQLKKPFNRMPSFDYLSDEEIRDIISFLNTI